MALDYDGTLEGLFALLDRLWTGALPEESRPRRVRQRTDGGGQGYPPVGKNLQAGLFDGDPAGGGEDPALSGDPRSAPGGGFRTPPALLPDPAALDGAAGVLFQVSADAYDALVYAWMSAFPVEAQALRYALKVLAAAEAAGRAAPGGGSGAPWYTRAEAREGAAPAARNRGDDDCRTVLAAAYKAAHEVDRLMGFLRFKPGLRGRYEARCAPDHFVLPALEPHFTRRFGDAPWAVIDERRSLALVMEREPRIVFTGGGAPPGEDAGGEFRFRVAEGRDPWEKLWRSYHRAVNIENRKNLSLQRQFVPLRYREYLTEFDPD
jgi:hypothetical protein